jgi:hypothetical protein
MYFVLLGLLLVVLPGAFVCSEVFFHPSSSVPVLFSVGKWWTFWAVGVRLFYRLQTENSRPYDVDMRNGRRSRARETASRVERVMCEIPFKCWFDDGLLG